MIACHGFFKSIFSCPGAGLHERGYSQAARAGTDILQTCFLLLLIGMLFTGCASVPKDSPRTSSTAFEDYLDTSVGKLFEEAVVQHPGKSGFTIIRYGRPAFTARIALTELAEKSLDLQYYIWETETTFGQRFMSGFIIILPVEHQL